MYDVDQAYSIVNEVKLATCIAFDEIIIRREKAMNTFKSLIENMIPFIFNQIDNIIDCALFHLIDESQVVK